MCLADRCDRRLVSGDGGCPRCLKPFQVDTHPQMAVLLLVCGNEVQKSVRKLPLRELVGQAL